MAMFKELKSQVTVGVISGAILFYFIQPIMSFLWNSLISIGERLQAGYLDTIYRSAALRDSNGMLPFLIFGIGFAIFMALLIYASLTRSRVETYSFNARSEINRVSRIPVNSASKSEKSLDMDDDEALDGLSKEQLINLRDETEQKLIKTAKDLAEAEQQLIEANEKRHAAIKLLETHVDTVQSGSAALAKVLIGFASVMLVLYLAISAIQIGIGRTISSFDQKIVILAPKVSDIQVKEWNAQWAQMRNVADFREIDNALIGKAAELDIKLPLSKYK